MRTMFRSPRGISGRGVRGEGARAGTFAGGTFALFAIAAVFLAPPGEAIAQTHPHVFFGPEFVPTVRARAQNPGFYYARPFEEILIDCRSTYGPGRNPPSLSSSSPRRRFYQGILAHAALLLANEQLASGSVDPRYDSDRLFFEYFWTAFRDSRWSNFFGNDPFGTAYLLVAFVHGYDWHFSRYTAAERAEIVEGLAARADYIVDNDRALGIDVPTSAELNDPNFFWLHTFKTLRNRTLIMCSALGCIAYGLRGEVPESRRQRWLDRAELILQRWSENASPDGVSHEGFSYHSFTNEIFYKFIVARFRATGRDAFVEVPYLREHPFYSIYSWVPGFDRSFLQPNPIGDVDLTPPAEIRSIDALIAAHMVGLGGRRDELANWMSFRPLSGESNNSYSRADPLQFIKAHEEIPLASPLDIGLPTYRYFPNRGHFVWRSSWDNQATYFAMMCGPQIGGHQQPELGNFVIYRGAPYIAHHAQSGRSKTIDHNVIAIDGVGQFGDRPASEPYTTSPQPPSTWGTIDLVVADDQFFDVFANVRPIYGDQRLQEFTREYVGFDDYFFVRDKLRLSSGSSANFESYLHAYSTTHPPLTDTDTLDPDSDPTRNPWSGGAGNVWTLRPRASGSIGTDPMTVQDLSQNQWNGRVQETMVGNKDDAIVRRGNALVRSVQGRSVRSLVGMFFPRPGDEMSRIASPTPGEEGFVLRNGGAVKAIGLWTDNGSVAGTEGLTFAGEMAGLYPPRNWYWGRNLSNLDFNGRNFVSSDRPISLFYRPGVGSGGVSIRIAAPQGAVATLDHPMPVGEVRVDGSLIPTSQWSYAGGRLTLTLDPAPSTREIATFTGSTGGSANLVNISTRGFVGSGSEIMIPGFIVSGTGSKTVLVSGVGPDLAQFGIPNALQNPVLGLFSGQTAVAANDNWMDFPGDIAGTGFAPNNPLEPAIRADLGPGAYTAHLSGADGGTGVGLVQVFDLGGEANLTNISTRLSVGTGERVMIAGLTVSGSQAKQLFLRGLGPTLADPPFAVPGAIADPQLELFEGQNRLSHNDNWGDSFSAAQIAAAGFSVPRESEPVLFATLSPGQYTVVLGPSAGTAPGVGLIEIFDLD